MKIKLLGIMILMSALLIGCTYLTPVTYDNNEYELIARLETSVKMIQENCRNNTKVVSLLPTLIYDARLLHSYTFYIPANTETYQMIDILKQDVLEFNYQYERGDATPLYCKLKSQIFLKKVRAALEVVATKRR